MKSTTEVTREVRRIVQDRINSGAAVRVEWLTTEILAMKDRIEGEDADFYIACGTDFVKRAVKRVVGEYDPKPEANTQIVMDGFDHLQKAYTVSRNSETMLVPVTMLSNAELEVRAQEYEAMAKGCVAHAKEIRAFIMGRADAA
ncbi:hypothetical protein JQW92_18175 [Sulfitobacter pseudonitzschiae]|uniref:hypothetical protein n=1 Tax=Pseudosulfitobacter pseudonitzschiae TaxID=1402135 RepID=UPI001AF88D0F|nr:hypothetical protein [Pseudosulfitobacter pseudonitzschiae]MBM1817175.1 hypothetical protein [Pseudosulfitobacter pseudonitzschiae]MBM1834186.1 hypothetical protein [Pseudosulfitobacter pseudonitzschiae]MBM1839051.1 hypothetical protein [Pseudosulfitobacter pseudonitzschiae]MBM1843899.1 hypothetical protein [Pseudosulfitobacter pseudonitzschiae]MBM1848736.1 hypothetical protein [Pseudosulfitobacter pseudonitzschiae]